MVEVSDDIDKVRACLCAITMAPVVSDDFETARARVQPTRPVTGAMTADAVLQEYLEAEGCNEFDNVLECTDIGFDRVQSLLEDHLGSISSGSSGAAYGPF